MFGHTGAEELINEKINKERRNHAEDIEEKSTFVTYLSQKIFLK
jgi:hypothetical protein